MKLNSFNSAPDYRHLQGRRPDLLITPDNDARCRTLPFTTPSLLAVKGLPLTGSIHMAYFHWIITREGRRPLMPACFFMS